MKPNNIAATLAAAGAFASASPSYHNHRHRHVDNHKRTPDLKVITVPGPTVVAYKLDDKLLEHDDVCEGFKNGTLQWADGSNGASPCDNDNAVDAAPSALKQAAPLVRVAFPSPISKEGTGALQKDEALHPATSQSTIADSRPTHSVQRMAESSAKNSESGSSDASSSNSSSYDLHDETGVDKEFPNGEIDCSDFPADFGPIKIPWMGLGGWSGIQYPTIQNSRVVDIYTAIAGGKGCSMGALCSYACPPGYQKSQWPSTQGSTGQTVGGLQCNSQGKLELTNPKLSKTLCMKGTGATKVRNKLNTNAAICRTDYPGTEDETVPLDTQAGSVNPLTCPDSTKYFEHEGLPTSAQYYVNNRGVPVDEACIWGVDGSGKGNWAPTYFGVGQDPYGKTWLSIASTKQNNPKSYSPLDYDAEIVGDGLSGKCKLVGGKYCSGDGYDDCNDVGCTVELKSGEASYVLTECDS
ncbi:MAG: hypothetical protein Q9174_005383 [Haloplaca sp. 1 TL-2023]